MCWGDATLAALPCPATTSSSNHALDGKSLCSSSLPRWICPTASPRRRYECGPTGVSLGGTGGGGSAAGAWGRGPAPQGQQVEGRMQGVAGPGTELGEEILLLLGDAWKSCCSWGMPAGCPHVRCQHCPHSWPCSTRRFSTPSGTAWASLSSSTSGTPRSSTPTCRRCIPFLTGSPKPVP